MLGDDWESVHQTWLHRLGNLTLTGYNSNYSNRPFEEKKTIQGGFEQSAVRLNGYVRKQTRWTATEMEERGADLASRAVKIWPHHNTDEQLILSAELQELRARAVDEKPESIRMSASVRDVLYAIRDSVRVLGESIEIVERRSLCYYDAQTAGFIAETLPMAGYVRILLPIDFEEVNDPDGVAHDATAWKFLPNVNHRYCGVFIDVGEMAAIPKAMALMRQAFNVAAE